MRTLLWYRRRPCRARPGAPLLWQTARVLAVRDETPRAKTFRLELPHRTRHMAGQYFIAAAHGARRVRRVPRLLAVVAARGAGRLDGDRADRRWLDDGEVSSYLHEVVEPGDELDVRGPVGGFFAWDGSGPVLLVAGGSGIVPLMAMLRLARRIGRPDLVRLLVSVRTPGDLYFADELPGPETTVVYTRSAPPGTARGAGRLTLADVAPLVRGGETVFVCGSAGFAEAATDLLLSAGVPTAAIRVERFGPSG